MKTQPSGVQALPQVAPSTSPAISFPRRSTVAELRKLREKHFREGNHELALQVSTEVAKRDPGRESFVRQGMLLREVGRWREALNVLRDALRFESGPQYLVADIHLHIAYTWSLLGKRKRVGESVRRAYALRLKPRTAFNFHMTYGNLLLSKKDFQGGLKEFLQAEKVAPSVQARGRAAINQGISLMRLWDFAAAGGPLDRAIRMLKKARCAAELAIARSARAAIHGDQGQHGRALGMFLHAARTFRRLGKVDRETEVLSNAGHQACLEGQFIKAAAILDRTISLASVTGQHLVLTCAYANRAWAYAENEDFDQAAASLAHGKRLLKGKRDWMGTLHLCRAQAHIAAFCGRWDEVFRVSRRAERLAARVGDALRVVEFRKLKGDAEGHRGRPKASSYARNSAGRLEVLLKAPKGEKFESLTTRLAATEMPVLILGESGTPKADIARAIHKSSAHAKGPCVIVPCEQLNFPASDLFGHAEGAWSGAVRPSEGFVGVAQGGTLVLDCVDRMTPEDQRILIPLLDRKVRAVGGVEDKPFEIRVVATCESLDGLTTELRSRLESAILRVPTLKERKTEIPHQVMDLLAGRRKISPDALAELARHRWEGNTVELRGAVDRLVAMSDVQIGKKLVRSILKATRTGVVAGRVHASRRAHTEAALAL
ncbi:MAG TPA: sigma 54-interacting transcriptional regulator [Planctomycetota bacterium]|nr:sigma 54-interacting transcriptional regulator [Planctomycetota bacterium]